MGISTPGGGVMFVGIIFQDSGTMRALVSGTDKAMLARQCREECNKLNKAQTGFGLAWAFEVLKVEQQDY
jgi:hypothetical protein